jgi:putative ABC transport system permease protein
MTPVAYLRRTVAFHARSHALALLGLAVAAAVITGSLVIGDSVRGSLRDTALARIGRVDAAVVGNGRFVRDALAARLAGKLPGATVAPVLQLRGLAANGERRANAIQVCGVDAAFWRLAPTPHALALKKGEVALNAPLAAQLGAKAGDSVLLRAEKPGFLPRDAPLSSTSDTTVVMRLTVAAVLDDAAFGRFSLAAAQVPAPTAFVDLATLQARAAMGAIANLLMVAGAGAPAVDAALSATWSPADALIEVRSVAGRTEVRAERIFLDPPLVAALAGEPEVAGVVSYFVNELRLGEKATPYSLVAAADWPRFPGNGAPLPGDLGDDGIAINEWLAKDLAAKPGDRLTLRYFVIGPSGGLAEAESAFTVRAVVPLEGAAADRELMPRFPGISDEEDCKNWHPGVPIDLGRIRQVDEAYWKEHRGTPKAFLSLSAGRRIWGNRFGDHTALRLPADPAAVTARLTRALAPADLGLAALPVRDLALHASAKAMDFSGLFIGLGFFLVVAALVLAGMLMALGIARRRAEVGVLLALGFAPRRVGRLLLGECLAVALLGSALGGALGVGYAAAVLAALAGGWSAAVGDAPVRLHLLPGTLIAGTLASALVATVVLRWKLRRLHREPIPGLLAGRGGEQAALVAKRPLVRIAAFYGLLFSLTCMLTLWIYPAGGGQQAGICFFAGVLFLIGGVCTVAAVLDQRLQRGLPALTLPALALANAARSRGRSVAVVTMLASACFLVVAVGANRKDPLANADRRTSGTGGFALVLETAVPLPEDLNAPADRERLGIDGMDGVRFTALRVGHGDDASCLNLNHSATPRLFAADPATLAGRFTFSGMTKPGGWELLAADHGDAVPAIGDENTTMWSLGLGVGDSLTYLDERGKHFTITLVGTVAHSLLQGGLFIAERRFTAHFPSQGGHRQWLVDVPPARVAAVAKELERALTDYGAVATPAPARLASYLAVERTYLDIFLALGGCALLLGSVGVGVVVARNVSERRGELAAARAIGFTRGALLRLLIIEHALLLVAGLAVGAGAGALAVWPALSAPGTPVPWRDLIAAFHFILFSGLAWIAFATRRALAGTTVHALRSE